MQFIQEIDRSIIEFIYNNLQHEIVIKVMSFITSLGNNGFIWIAFICILFLTKKYRKIACVAALSFLLSRLIGVQILKPLIHRPRPFLELTYIDIYIPKPTSYSFPSGHAISSFATVWVIVKMIERPLYKIILIVFSILIASSRVYLMVHYLSDVLGGIALGLICSYIALCTFKETKITNNID